MHILFLTDNFPPEVNAPATRTFEHSREWVNLGHKVTVITCAPNFPKGRVFEGYRNRLRSRETMDGIDVIRVWTVVAANEGLFWRTLDYASFMVSAVPASLTVSGVDVIVATSPQLFAPCAAYLSGSLKRRPFVFEVRDLWPESIRAVGAMRNSTVLDWLEKLELFLYRRATAIVSVTSAFRENLVARGIDRTKIDIVMNGADLTRFRPRARNVDLASKLGLVSKLVCGYVGTHGMAHHLTTVLEAASLIKDRPECRHIHFLFLGDGAEKEALQVKAEDLNLDNVVFVDTVPRDQVAEYWSLIDISIIHLRKTPLFETVIPSKLFECMAMGIPVLHGVAGESAEIVRREGVGLCFEPQNAGQLAQLIVRLDADPRERAELSRRAATAAMQYDRKVLAEQMLATLSRVQKARARDTVEDVKSLY